MPLSLKTPNNIRAVQKILGAVQEKRRATFTHEELACLLRQSWQRRDMRGDLTSRGIKKYMWNTLENPVAWLGLKATGRRGCIEAADVRDLVCERFDYYLTALGYAPEERQKLFIELARYNSAVQFPGDTIGEQR